MVIVIANQILILIQEQSFLSWIVFLTSQDIQTVIVTAVTGVYLPLILNLFLRIISYNCVMNLLIVNSCHSH